MAISQFHNPRRSPRWDVAPRRRAGESHRQRPREMRENLIARLRAGDTLFPGIIGYDDTVVPQVVNAVLSRHNFILLGLRGQAKSRILRALTDAARRRDPGGAGLRDPRRSAGAALRRVPRRGCAEDGDASPIGWLARDARYVEKLATPDVTIADMIGDLDPIKAARAGLQLSDELTMHYGLLPRANRGIFAINELPDLAGKIQVGLFNILQEGDVQIKGYPVRLPLDVLMVVQRQPGGLHRARQDHHAAQGPHRLGDPHALPGDAPARDGHHRAGGVGQRPQQQRSQVPAFVREVVEEIAFQARAGSEGRQALGRQPAPADLAARERGLERRAPRADCRRGRSSCRASPTSTPRCRRSPASSSWNTKASCAAPTTSPATSSAPPSATSSAATSPLPTSARSPSGSTSAARCSWTTRCRPRSCCARTCRGPGPARAGPPRRRQEPARRRRSSPPPSTSSSRGSTRRRRSAAPTSGSIRAPSRRAARPRGRAAAGRRCCERETYPLPGNKKKY